MSNLYSERLRWSLREDFTCGDFAASHTVDTQRINLFCLQLGKKRHIATLVAGSATRIDRFNLDAQAIVRGLYLTQRLCPDCLGSGIIEGRYHNTDRLAPCLCAYATPHSA